MRNDEIMELRERIARTAIGYIGSGLTLGGSQALRERFADALLDALRDELRLARTCDLDTLMENQRLRMALDAICTLTATKEPLAMFGDRHADPFRAAQAIARAALSSVPAEPA